MSVGNRNVSTSPADYIVLLKKKCNLNIKTSDCHKFIDEILEVKKNCTMAESYRSLNAENCVLFARLVAFLRI